MRRLLNCGLTLTLLLLVAACTRAPEAVDNSWFTSGGGTETGDAVVYRSPADDRGYRYLTLANGIKTLLISDPEADKAAASLNVHAGSFQNPAEREGLAHFLEHMLFLGTEKYPEPEAYQAFISKHGGTHNAYTSLEQTNYFFDIDASYLEQTLDRFAQFFIAPLFNPEYVGREQHAVESEFRLNIKDDNRREWDVLREVVNPEHPLSKFSVGSLDTLADRENDPVREDLLSFYEKYYSANLMTLVVLGRESLDELQQMVEERFLAVPNRNLTVADERIPLFSEQLPMLVEIKPEKERRELNLLFPLPPLREYWRVKPAAFLGHLIGDESEGSLLADLKRRGLAERLSAGPAFDTGPGAAFQVNLVLTPAGFEQRDEILVDLFAYVSLVVEEGIEEWRYREFAELQKINFRFADKGSPMGYVQQLSARLHDYPPEEVVRGDYLLENFDAGVIKQFADDLSPGNVQITLVAPEVVADRRTMRYEAPYRMSEVAPENLQAWKQASAGKKYYLPPENPYIPTDFTLLEGNDEKSVPRLSESVAGSRLWYYADHRFRTPKADFNAFLATPRIKDAAGTAMAELYLALVKDELSAEVYPANLAGVDFNLGRWENGISLSINGYNHRQPVLLGRVLDTMAAPRWDKAVFERVKAMMIREWNNTRKEIPVRQAFQEITPLVRRGWRPEELAAALEPVDMETMQAQIAGLFHFGHGLFYAGGNISRETAETMTATVMETLGVGVKGDAELYYQVLKLNALDPLPAVEVAVDHNDAAAVLYIQGRNDSLEERALFALLQTVTESPFFHSLRTEKQLGYVVGNMIAPMHRVPGMAFYIQSPVSDAPTLKREVNRFLEAFREIMDTMDAVEVDRYRKATLANIEEAPKNLMELNGRHLESLTLDYLEFDFRDRLAAAVRSITPEALKKAYGEILLPPRRGLWSVTADPSVEPGQSARIELAEEASGYYRYRQ